MGGAVNNTCHAGNKFRVRQRRIPPSPEVNILKIAVAKGARLNVPALRPPICRGVGAVPTTIDDASPDFRWHPYRHLRAKVDQMIAMSVR
jgi:hypothetical protein